MKSLRLLSLVAAALIVSCGGEPEGARPAGVKSAGSPLLSPDRTPVPCAENGAGERYSLWHGDTVDLVTADALVACASNPRANPGDVVSAHLWQGEAFGDRYAVHVVDLMKMVTPIGVNPNPNASLASLWAAWRIDEDRNCDPDSLGPGRNIDLYFNQGVEEYVPTGPLAGSARRERASIQLRTAGLNLCVAQRLRELSPGASAGETLFLSDAEQRKMLHVIRERAQIAMLTYATLGSVFAGSDVNPAPTTFGNDYTIGDLQYWAERCEFSSRTGTEISAAPGCTTSNLLALMGDDFATAVQLHTVVSKEELELLARSRSARTPSGVEDEALAEREWGAESWHQRLLAAAFGGDPTQTNGNPWPHFFPWIGPGIYPAANTLALSGQLSPTHEWPWRLQLPYYERARLTPQARKFLNLARRFDSLKLVVDSTLLPDGSCVGVDEEASASELLKRVEADLRYEGCFGGEPCPTSPADVYPTLGEYSDDYVLWNDYRVKPEHVRAAVTWLSESSNSGKRFGVCGGTSEMESTNAPADLVGEVVVDSSDADSPSGESLKFSAETQFASVALQDQSPRYTRNAVHRIPDPQEVQPTTPPDVYGLQLPCGELCAHPGVESKRAMGAISALVAVRQALMRNLSYLDSPGGPGGTSIYLRRSDYLRHAEKMVEVINAAVGVESAVVRPSLDQSSPDDVAVPAYPTQPSRHLWEIEITYDASDTYWQPGAGVAHFVVLLDNAHAANFGRYPDTAVQLGPARYTFGSLVGAAQLQGRFGLGVAVPEALDDFHGGTLRRFYGVIPVRDRENETTLVVARVSEDGVEPRVVGARFNLDGQRITEGQHIAAGGDLGGFVSRQVQAQQNDPVKHAYDGFDLPTDWVPPYNAELIGGASTESSSDFYLALARSTAEEATRAVERAIDFNTQQAFDESARAEAVARARAGTREVRDTMCGGGNSECDFEVVNTNPNPDWYDGAPSEATCSTGPLGAFLRQSDFIQKPMDEDKAKLGLRCFVWELTKSLYALNVKVAKPVLDTINEPAVPGFAQFEGGELQSAFIEQWRALRAPGEKLRALEAARVSASDAIGVASQALANANRRVKSECGAGGFLRSAANSFSIGTPIGPGGGGSGGGGNGGGGSGGGSNGGGGLPLGGGVNFSPGPMLEHGDKCERATDGLKLAQKQAAQSQSDALAVVTSAVIGLVDAQAAIQQSSAAISRITNQSNLAQQRFELEETLAERSFATSFGLARKYRSYDVWRAKVLMDSARRYSLAARRAIEARYVVDLSTLTEDEPFVASPATWADEVYEYDLSLPNSVGLAVGSPQSGAIYSNKVSDYVSNLEAFVAGYAVDRPSAVAASDIEVVTLPGMSLGEAIGVDDGSGEVFFPERGGWSGLCSDGIWRQALASSSIAEACGRTCASCGFSPGCSQDELDECSVYERPSRVRLEFNLDPWGRVNTFLSNEPFGQRHNGRWGQLAVNLVGTGIKQCEFADDQLGCYGEGFVRFNLTHVGDAWLTNYDGDWLFQNVPQGRIEGGKALAAELWLDPLQDGWSTPYIGAVSRTEFALRPLSGAYALELEVRPELNLERIERVQILVGSTYWVRQD